MDTLSRRSLIHGIVAVAGFVLLPLRRVLGGGPEQKQAGRPAATQPGGPVSPAVGAGPSAGGRVAAGPAGDADLRAQLVEVEGADAKKMVAAALASLGGIERFVKKGHNVVLKPNISFASPLEWGTQTHPEVVMAVAQACLDAGAKSVTVIEYLLNETNKCLKRSGLGAALKTVPAVKLQLLGDPADFETVPVPGGVAYTKAPVAKLVLAADVLINLPIAKSHSATGVSFGLKNAMGLIEDRSSFHGPIGLDRGISDLARLIKPHLTILDATRVLLTNGPAGPGESATLGKIVAGIDPVAVDAYGLTLARYNGRALTPADVKHIELAAQSGLGEADVRKLTVRKVRV